MKNTRFEELNFELKKVLKKHEYVPKTDMLSAEKIIKDYIENFGNEEIAILMSLMSIGNLLKHVAELSHKYEPGYWEELMSDDVISLNVKYASALMRLRK